jgi:hypothetical protein
LIWLLMYGLPVGFGTGRIVLGPIWGTIFGSCCKTRDSSGCGLLAYMRCLFKLSSCLFCWALNYLLGLCFKIGLSFLICLELGNNY